MNDDAGYGKRFQTHIDAHSMAVLGQRFWVYQAGEAGMASAVFLLNGERLWYLLEYTTLWFDLYPSSAMNCKH
jgi:hypothetical protein